MARLGDAEYGQLSDDERQLLADFYEMVFGPGSIHGFPEFRRRPPKRQWLRQVASYLVEVRPGGRAIIRSPGDSYRVELIWVHNRDSDDYDLEQVRIVPEERSLVFRGHELQSPGYLGLVDALFLDLTKFYAAFTLRVKTFGPIAASRPPRKRPRPGEAPDPDFYKRLLRSYNALIGDGVKDPAQELARRMDAKHSTVKVWLHRARKYLSEEES